MVDIYGLFLPLISQSFVKALEREEMGLEHHASQIRTHVPKSTCMTHCTTAQNIRFVVHYHTSV